MAIDFRGDCHLEMDALASQTEGLGIDGMFVDCPKSAARWKRGFLKPPDPITSPPNSVHAAVKTSRNADVADDDEEVEVEPAAAISTYVIVGVLIVICGVYAWVRRHEDAGLSVHGAYKVMTSPRVSDGENEGSRRDSQRESQHGQTLEIE